VNRRRGEEGFAVLIERGAELKRDLVDFACSSRLERSLAAAMLEAGLEEVEEADAISTIDRFALQYRLPDGKTVVDRFVASRPDPPEGLVLPARAASGRHGDRRPPARARLRRSWVRARTPAARACCAKQ
jgi:hypothetical protein